MKAVRFHEYGGIDVLRVEEVKRPTPGPGQVLVEVRAAGIQPGEAHIREGALHARWPATFLPGRAAIWPASWWRPARRCAASR